MGTNGNMFKKIIELRVSGEENCYHVTRLSIGMYSTSFIFLLVLIYYLSGKENARAHQKKEGSVIPIQIFLQ